MASAEEYANWIVQNADKRGTPEFDTVAKAYQIAKTGDRRAPAVAQPDALDHAAVDLTAGMSSGEQFAAGIGRSATNLARGAGQLVGAVSRDDVKQSRERDAALLAPGSVMPAVEGGKMGVHRDPSRPERTTMSPGAMGDFAGDIATSFGPGAIVKLLGKIAPMFRASPQVADAISTAGRELMLPKTVTGAAAGGAVQGVLRPSESTAETAANIGYGVVGNSAVPVVTRAALTAKAALEPFYNKGQEQIIGRLFNRSAGDEASALAARARLAASGEIVPGSAPTVGQVADNAGIAALERTTAAIDPAVTQAYAARHTAQNDARKAVIDDIAGTEAGRAAAVAARAKETGDLRTAAIRESDYGTAKTADLENRISGKARAVVSGLQDEGRFATRAAEQQHLADTWTPVPGQPRMPGRYAPNAERVPEAQAAAGDAAQVVTQRKAERDFLERQLDSLKQAGYSPLNAKAITNSITGTLGAPGMRASSVVQKTLGDVKDKLASLADKNGHISAADLYTVRKELGNTIAVHAKDSGNWDKKLTAGLERGIQKAIDEQMRKAGAGKLWDDYLSKYQELSKPINQMDLGQAIRAAATDKVTGRVTPAAFARALDDKTAVNATGYGNATLENTLEPQNLTRLQAVLEDLRRARFAETAGKGPGSDTVQKLAYSNLVDRSGVPTWISNRSTMQAPARLATGAANWLYGKANKEISSRLAEMGLNPQQVAKAMDLAATPRGDKLLNVINSGGSLIGRTAALSLLNAQQQ